MNTHTPKTPPSLLVAVCSIIVATVMVVVGFSTTYWCTIRVDQKEVLHYGLFKVCGEDGHCQDTGRMRSFGKKSFGDAVDPSKFMCIGAFLAFGSIFIMMAYLRLGLKLKVRSKTIGVLTFCVSVLGAILAIASVCNFVQERGQPDSSGDHIYWEFGYSMYITAFSGPLCLASGICFLIAVSRLHAVMLPGVHQVAAPISYVYPQQQQLQQQQPYQAGTYPPQQPHPGAYPGNQGFAPNQPYATNQYPPTYS